MMYVFAVRDSAMDSFMQPFFAPAVGLASRSFSDEVNRSSADNAMFRHPDDYELHLIGTFDESTGHFSNEGMRLISRGKDVKTPS